ncbi:MAG: SMP-30/gluconolactonase/LRE family protein [Alphaproteobacteria bacterium]|nr:SMP-30/gluconolactonase/LRE family protein [Alphaproteobacteria bacterium]
MILSARRLSAKPSLLGESPVWDPERQRIYWVDGVSRMIHALDTLTDEFHHWEVPSTIGSLALAGGDGLIVGLADGIYSFDLATGRLEPLYRTDPADSRVRFNDGKVDRNGRFLCGSMGVFAEARGELIRVSPGGNSQVLANGIRISNALCFSPDGSVMYFADSLDRNIRAYRYVPGDGPLEEARVLVDTNPYNSGPDGATVDSDGCIWVALIQVGKIARFTPEGELDRLIEAPTDMPSCVAFGGPDMATLYVTTIKDSGTGRAVSRHPAGGHLFAIEGLGATGIPETRFGHAQ